jgi:hypothetical protein
MSRLTTEQVLALAPDAPSAKAGSALATARKWATLGCDAEGRMGWGECQGSGAKPYQTQADLSEPAFRCSCPSRKFPCKHSLALLLLLAAEPGKFGTGEWPAWVVEWATSRQARAEKRAAKQEREADAAEKPVDPAARAKRIAARADRISAGVAELDLWLRDLVRGGIAGAESRPNAFWEEMGARLVDAQAPGAARLVRDLSTMPATRDGWHGRMVERLGRLHLLASAWTRIDALSAESQADVRAHLGWATTEAELADAPGVDDRWLVTGQLVEEEDRLRARRTWMYGVGTGRSALLLHFAAGTASFGEMLPPVGDSFAAELVFFPGSHAQRALLRSRREDEGPEGAARAAPPGERRLSVAIGALAGALALDPWTERVSLLLDGVIPEHARAGWLVRDEQGDVLPISPRFRDGWTLLAVSGGHPVWMSAEWTGEHLLPLAVAHGGSLLPLVAT